jgi:acetyl esterase/lipase
VLTSLLVASPGLVVSGYLAVRRAVIALLYKPAVLPEEQVCPDIPYREGSDHPKHKLDLFVPKGTNWPTLIFMHGGALTSGDKRLRVGGADVYGNIGRFYASQGIGVVLVNYRLQPGVTWRDQVDDVAHAVKWVYDHVGTHGGDNSRMFISGHSAGAYLAARVALDPEPLSQFGLSPKIFSGVIATSGAALDLCDAQTYELGHKLRDYEARFRCGDPTESWKTIASPVHCVTCGAPPFLILYAEEEHKSLQRQSQLLHEALQRNEIPSELVAVPGQNHCRMVLTLSRPDRTSAPAILRFIRARRPMRDLHASIEKAVGQLTSGAR